MNEGVMRLTLKSAREINKFTQEQAAKLIGISVDTLGNYERGKSYPDIPILRKIEEVYGVPYNRLIFLPLDYDKTVNLIWEIRRNAGQKPRSTGEEIERKNENKKHWYQNQPVPLN